MTVDRQRDVTVRLSEHEALVLFDCLSRWSDETGEGDVLRLTHRSEHWGLNALLSALEREFVAPFTADYRQRVDAVRSLVLSEREGVGE